MSKLLRAGFHRLWRSWIFWACMAFTVGFGLFSVATCRNNLREMPELMMEGNYYLNFLFNNSFFMLVVAAAFVGLFIGTEYSDGTIRNKLVIGHRRRDVYVSNLIVCTVAILLQHLGYIAVVIALGLPQGGRKGVDAKTLGLLFLLSLAVMAALSAMCVMISMLIHSQAVGVVVAIMVSLVLMMSAMVLSSSLNEPEYFDAYDMSYTDEDGQTHEEHMEKTKNPHYLEGTRRQVYEFLYDFTPGGQCHQLTQQSALERHPEDPEKLPLYALIFWAGTTVCGILVFRRKNLK